MPVPISVMSAWTVTWPFASMRRAPSPARDNWLGSRRPCRSRSACGRRDGCRAWPGARCQPKRSRPSRMQAMRLRLENGHVAAPGRAPARCGCAARSDRAPSFSASSSMAHSSASRPEASPGARIHSPRLMSRRTSRWLVRRFGRGIERPGRDRALFGEFLEARRRGGDLMADARSGGRRAPRRAAPAGSSSGGGRHWRTSAGASERP